MRTVTIPHPVTVPQPDGPKEYKFGSFIIEHVLSDVRWRKEWAPTFGPVAKKLTADVGPSGFLIVDLTDEEHERVEKCVTAARIDPPFVIPLMPFVHAITLATTTTTEAAK